MTGRIILATLCTVLLASSASADDFDRPGWYVGAGGGVAWDFLSTFVQEQTGGLVDSEPTGTANVRGGYRVVSWFAVEAMYEGAYDYSVDIAALDSAATLTTHSVLVNAKFIIPSWRIQPYFALGGGGQYGDFDGTGILASADTTRWDFMLRFGLGLDTYITKHWIVNFEVAPAVRFTDYSDIASESTDNVSLTLSAGVQYRF